MYLLDDEENWKSIQGRFISVIGTNISCKCARTPTGMSPHAHIGDGHIDLVLIRKASRAKYLHHLIKVSQKTSSHVSSVFYSYILLWKVLSHIHYNPI